MWSVRLQIEDNGSHRSEIEGDETKKRKKKAASSKTNI